MVFVFEGLIGGVCLGGFLNTVRNVHGRGLGFGKEGMGDDTELEEGEAGTYHEETSHHIDPDVAFAYIVQF